MNWNFYLTKFKALNFTLGNEDNDIEYDLLPEGVGHAMTVAGSGARVLALLAKAPKKLTCVDMAPEQLHITELRIEAVRRFSYEDYLAFWAYPNASPMAPDVRKEMFCSLELSPASRSYLEKAFNKLKWQSMLYAGQFERLMYRSTYPARVLLGKEWHKIFDCNDLDEQRRFFWTKFPRRRLDFIIFSHSLVHDVFFVVYPSLMPRNIPENFHTFFRRMFYTLFSEIDVKSSLLIQIYFCGELKFLQAAPPECHPTLFENMKKALADCRIDYLHDSIFTAANNSSAPIDFLSLSNVPSYVSGELEKTFMQDFRPRLGDKALVVMRSHLHVPEGTNFDGYQNITETFGNLNAREKTQLYQIDVYRKADQPT